MTRLTKSAYYNPVNLILYKQVEMIKRIKVNKVIRVVCVDLHRSGLTLAKKHTIYEICS